MAATLRVRFTTDDASDTTPSWTDVSDQVRSFTITQGSDNEFSKVDAATATIVVDNRVQQFDPTDDPTIRPMNRWEITEMITGEVQFVGYARSYTQQWPAPGVDAVTVVECVDEFMVLALDRLPTMDPPTAQTYADVVAYDQPQGYWRFQDINTLSEILPTIGSVSLANGTQTKVTGPIVGDWPVNTIAGVHYSARSTTGFFYSIDGADVGTQALEAGGPGDATGLSAFTYEQWFRSSEATPAAERIIAEGPWDSSPTTTWAIVLTTAGKIRGYVRNTVPTLATATGATSISANTWYHIAIVYNGTNVLVYLNGVQDGTAALTGNVLSRGGATNQYLSLGRGTPGGTRYYDEVAWYRYAVSADRLLAHYTAGANRGYIADDPDDRADAIMADSTSIAAFDFTSTHGVGREIIPTFQYGQSPLDELRRCEDAEQGFLFVAKDGTVTMLRENYQGDAPYDTVQAAFDDDGTDLKFRSVDVDYSSSFLFNDITMSREGGVTENDTDATSIATYLRRPLIIPALPITDDGNIASFVANLLAKYKDPVNRITSLTVDTSDQDVANAVLPLDLGARVQVNVTQPNSGRIQQELHVRKRTISGTPGAPWIITLGLSPY